MKLLLQWGTSCTVQEIKQSHVSHALLRIHRFVGVGCFSQVSLNVSEQSVRKYCPSFSERTHDRHATILSGNLNQANTTMQQSCTKIQKGREAGKADASRSPKDRNWRREGQETKRRCFSNTQRGLAPT